MLFAVLTPARFVNVVDRLLLRELVRCHGRLCRRMTDLLVYRADAACAYLDVVQHAHSFGRITMTKSAPAGEVNHVCLQPRAEAARWTFCDPLGCGFCAAIRKAVSVQTGSRAGLHRPDVDCQRQRPV